MKAMRLAVISALIFLAASAPDVSAGCKYWDCYTSVYGTYAECKQIICPSWSTNCNGSNWATDCTVTCDGAEVVLVVGVMPESGKAAWARALEVARQERITAQRSGQ